MNAESPSASVDAVSEAFDTPPGGGNRAAIVTLGVALLVLFATFALYAMTLAPTVGFGNDGALQADAVDLRLGGAADDHPLFVLAALIESFVRESALGLGPRFAVAGAMGLLVAAGLLWSRRLARASADRGWLSEVIAPARSGSPGSG